MRFIPALGGIWRPEARDQGPGGGDRAHQQPVTGRVAFKRHFRRPAGGGAGVSEERTWAEEPPAQGAGPPPQHVWCGLHRQCPPDIHLRPAQRQRHPNHSALPKCRGANKVDIDLNVERKCHVYMSDPELYCHLLIHLEPMVTLYTYAPL